MSKNVFADLGFPNPEEHLLKAQIVSLVATIIRTKELPQTRVAELTGLTQPQISNILRGRFRDVSIEKLLRIVNALKHNIHIVIDAEPVDQGDATTTVDIAPSDKQPNLAKV